MSFYFYLARCSDDSLYAGYCKNLTEREATHNNGTGAKYTRAKGPIEMVYSESFETKSEAMKREYAVKKMTKEQKESLITLDSEAS
ncbi:GIY-YIG nuclease family protein [bacterium]|nr:GIY-YIG nuclease family protein [bacterium]NCQ55865.1 GIY-YIG nuclease family protein [Candidatus Parcubacteria bacterium]NCS67573.1 GIY-YIG nuclease family protein [Candidatus Peregrinibacteria bacterium]NCS96262.1 GIY-YIG nuclease family protein [bacterium]